MNNYTTPQTSARLKAAGFPQPAPEVGQVWLEIGTNLLYIILHISDNGEFECSYFGFPGSRFVNEQFDTRDTFAPTATDILRELGGEFNISYVCDTYLIIKDGIFAIKPPETIASHTNPAEAAALAWLSLNETKHG